MSNYFDGNDEQPVIAKVEASAVPKPDGTYAEDERPWYKKFWSYLLPKLKNAPELGEEYLKGTVTEKTATATRTLEEAGLRAAERESAEANTRLIRQKEVGEFISNLERAEALQSDGAKMLAFHKIIEANPELLEQQEKIEKMIEKLRLQHGLSICPSDEQGSASDDQLEFEANNADIPLLEGAAVTDSLADDEDGSDAE